MKINFQAFFATAAVLSLSAAATQATSLGINIDPAGSAWDRNTAGTAYATWDTFSGTSFTNDAAGSSFGVTNPFLSQSSVFTNFGMGAGLYKVSTSTPSTTPADNDVLFAGGNNVNFTITGELSFTAYGLYLQIKRPGSTGTMADASGFAPTLTINGVTFSADGSYFTAGSGDTSSTAGTYSVTTWYWGSSLTGIADTGSSTYTVSFSKTAFQRTMDGISVDFGSVAAIAPVPEPGTWAIGGALVVLLAFRVHRMRATKVCG